MEKTNDELKEIARKIRVETIKSVYLADSGHIGSSLSIVDVLTALYFDGVLRFDPKNPIWDKRDFFILSNGHAVPGLYACLAYAGFYPVERLDQLRALGSPMEGHAKRGAFPGIEVSTGSLGQGLNVAVGIAIGLNLRGKDNRVFVMMSDGDQQEGSTWEALMYVSKFKLNNLIVIIDNNGNQINGPTNEIMPGVYPLADKYRAFHWEVIEIDGHDYNQIRPSLKLAQQIKNGPVAIISHTVTGKGVSQMEGKYQWHHGHISQELFAVAMRDLGENIVEAKTS